MTVGELVEIVLEYAPLSGEVPGDMNGLLYGDPQAEVTGVATTWTPSLAVLREAAAEDRNFVLTHEILFFPSTEGPWYATIPTDERPHNLARQRLLDRHGIAVCRCHSNWDRIPEHGIADAFAATLGLGEAVYRSTYLRMYQIEPVALARLALDAKAKLGVPHVRVGGELSRVVRTVGIAYGGFGQSWQCLDEFIMQCADVVFLGEGIDYTFRAAVDAGLAVIETSHVGSENPGMRAFARLLAERLPDLPVRFIDAGHPWVSL